MKVRDAYPDLFKVSCEACKLDCNVCYNCDLSEFLECDLVPEGCVLKYNIKQKMG